MRWAPDLGNLSERARRDYLVPSSGWIGDIIIPLANITGIWDIFLLSLLFIVSWTTIRTSDRVIALILARVFDTTIPLQHYLSTNAAVQQLHAEHCQRYWPIWCIASAIEAGAYFLFHPDLFTLVTCFKTTALTVVWHGRNADGTFWTSGMSLEPSTTGLKNTISDPQPIPSDRPTRPTAPETSSSRFERKKDVWEELLKKKEFDKPTRQKMLQEVSEKSIPEQQKLLAEWRGADEQKLKSLREHYG